MSSHPFWSTDGRLLYYVPTGANAMIRTAVRARRMSDESGNRDGDPLAVILDRNGHAGISARDRTTCHTGTDPVRAGRFPRRHLDDGSERRTAMTEDRQHDDDKLDETI